MSHKPYLRLTQEVCACSCSVYSENRPDRSKVCVCEVCVMSRVEATAAAEPVIAARWQTPLELTLLGAIWGASFLFMRVSAREFGALPLVEMRLVLGGWILLPDRKTT